MEPKFDKTYYLNQIPVFALRGQLLEMLKDPDFKAILAQRLKKLHKRRRAPNPETFINTMVRDELVRLVKKCPELDEDRIFNLFQEYRYGSNPSFFIYLFNAEALEKRQIAQIRPGFNKGIEEYNKYVPKDTPRVRNLVSDGLVAIQEDEAVIEGAYHFQRRLELIDEDENPRSIYETLYGFFWINTQRGYVVIQSQDRSILHALENAISEGADIHLVNLLITKELKNALPFLLNEDICSSKLHDPNPKSRRFRWISITDDDLFHKGYKQWETRYPEVSSARYKVNITGIKDRTLNISFDYGAMSISGKLTASQFRDWSLHRLSEIITKIEDFKKQPSKYLKTRRFMNVKELAKFNHTQKEWITKILASVLDLKTASAGLGAYTLEVSPLEIARDLKNYVYVQFVIPCQTEDCSPNGYLTCPDCGSRFFHVLETDGKWTLECAGEKRKAFSTPVPFQSKCEQEHMQQISVPDLERYIEIIPGRELLETLSEIVRLYIPGQEFYAEREIFIILGSYLRYYADSGTIEPDTLTSIHMTVEGNIENSNIVLGSGNQIIQSNHKTPPKEKGLRKQAGRQPSTEST